MSRITRSLGLALVLSVAGVPAFSDVLYIAGTKPSQRPEAAPVLTEYAKDAAWYSAALHGVSAPYPYSLRFLEDAGAWFIPFLHSGMTGPYDIRDWH